ncbi:MAG: hypothetical protein FWG85_08135 [Bacteroidetes bacterium]|nr:hypothetical protein [Bacteroidota bacterium]
MKKYLTLLAVILAMQNANAQGPFGGGNGTPASPYLITTRQHLEFLANHINDGGNVYSGCYFKLINSITEPITTVIAEFPRQFIGYFDGQGHTISLAINSESGYIGLFGYTGNSVIKNVILDGYVNGEYNVGGLVGYLYNTSITNCINNAIISGVDNYVGGLVGYVGSDDNMSISYCINNGNVSGNEYIGGIVGYTSTLTSSNTSISNCMNLGNITGKGYIGGINGCGLDAIITYCVNYGFVKGIDSGVGGINGYDYHTIENSINIGIVEGEDASVTGAISGKED